MTLTIHIVVELASSSAHFGSTQMNLLNETNKDNKFKNGTDNYLIYEPIKLKIISLLAYV